MKKGKFVSDTTIVQDRERLQNYLARANAWGIVQWWHKDWRDIIINGGGKYTHKVTGDNTSSLDRIIAQGFDGVFLDNADACAEVYWDAFEKYWLEHGGIPE